MKIFSIYSLIHISQIYIMYYGTLRDGKHSPGLEESFDTKLYSEDDIPWDELAFPIITENLKLYYEKGKPTSPYTGIVDKVDNEYIITRN